MISAASHSFTASEFRRLHRKVGRADRRLSLIQIPGKVKPGSQDMETRTLRLVIGQATSGEDVLSPPVRWDQSGAGRLKVHSAPADNEQMTLESASGVIGSGSKARFATYDQDHEPPSTDPDRVIIQFDGVEMVLTPTFVIGRIGKCRFLAHDQGAKIRDGPHFVSVQEETGVWASEKPKIGEDPVPE